MGVRAEKARAALMCVCSWVQRVPATQRVACIDSTLQARLSISGFLWVRAQQAQQLSFTRGTLHPRRPYNNHHFLCLPWEERERTPYHKGDAEVQGERNVLVTSKVVNLLRTPGHLPQSGGGASGTSVSAPVLLGAHSQLFAMKCTGCVSGPLKHTLLLWSPGQGRVMPTRLGGNISPWLREDGRIIWTGPAEATTDMT